MSPRRVYLVAACRHACTCFGSYVLGSTPQPGVGCPGGAATFRNTSDCATHIVAWRPVPAEDTRRVTLDVDVSAASGGQCAAPQQAWLLGATHSSGVGLVAVSTPATVGCGKWRLQLSASPLVIALPAASAAALLPADALVKEAPGCGVDGNCGGHGVCVDNRRCVCAPSRRGKHCELPACPNACWNNGECNDDGTCDCYRSFNTRGWLH